MFTKLFWCENAFTELSSNFHADFSVDLYDQDNDALKQLNFQMNT